MTDPLCIHGYHPHTGRCWGYTDEIRADERERAADLIQMKFSMTSARSHDSGCVCILCAINSTLDAAVDRLRGGESDG